jgi:hypothetical protein
MINKQDNSTNGGAFSFENSEGQRVLLSCNRASPRCPSLGSNVLPPEAINKLEELGGILKRIHLRMKSEGYDLIDGAVMKIDDYEKINKNNR